MAVSKLRFPTQHQGHMMSLTTSTIIFLLAMDADGRLAWFRRMWLPTQEIKFGLSEITTTTT